MYRFYEVDKAMTAELCPLQPMPKLTVYFGCSRWTNASRNHAGHIANEGEHPLCGKTYRGGASDRKDLAAETAHLVTCAKCKKLSAFDLKFSGK